MKLLKKLAVVAALSSIASYASALTPIADSDLSKVSGRDGVSIAADLHITIGEFKYTDTDTNGGSVSFNNIKISGVIAATIDIINNTQFNADALAAFPGANGTVTPNPNTILAVTGGDGLKAFAPTGDVVKIAIPEVTTAKNLAMSVDSIKLGNSDASFGKFEMKNMQLQGTTVYIWAH